MAEHFFPLCELHNCRLVTALPDACPLAAQNPIDALQALNEGSFWHPSDGDPHAAVASAAALRICSPCVDRLLAHPHIKFLRGQS